MRRALLVLVASVIFGGGVACSGECDDTRQPPAKSIERGPYGLPDTSTGDELVVSEDGRSVEHTFTTDAGTWKVRYRVVDAGFVAR